MTDRAVLSPSARGPVAGPGGLAAGEGCITRVGPERLPDLLRRSGRAGGPGWIGTESIVTAEILVGPPTREDPAVPYVSPDLALVQNRNRLTPVVADPDIFGQIAAADPTSDGFSKSAPMVEVLGQDLIKALGTALLMTAYRFGAAGQPDVVAAVTSVIRSNYQGSEANREVSRVGPERATADRGEGLWRVGAVSTTRGMRVDA